MLLLIKSLLHGDWIPYLGMHSSFVGAPFGLNLGDYPFPEQIQFLFLKVLGVFNSDPIWVYNFYYLSSFALTTVTFMFAMRRFRVQFPVALALGLLYSFLPYHLLRYPHLFLAAYYMLPLLGVILLWVWSSKPLFFKLDPAVGWRTDFSSRRSVFSLITVFVAGGMGLYYAFFFSMFSVVAGVSAAWRRKSRRHFYSALILAGIATASVTAAGFSNLVYRVENGPNHEVVGRNHFETEVYGLKLSQVLLPRANNRIRAFARLRERYRSGTAIVEGYEESFCLFGGMGVVFLPVFKKRLHGLRQAWALAHLGHSLLIHRRICAVFRVSDHTHDPRAGAHQRLPRDVRLLRAGLSFPAFPPAHERAPLLGPSCRFVSDRPQ